jgi:hypothetical protein
MQLAGALNQYLLGLEIVGVRDTAIHRTHRRAGLMIIEAHALGALGRHDIVDVLGQRRASDAVELPRHAAGINRGIRALGLASSAVDALARDCRCHLGLSLFPSGRFLASYLI